HQGVPIVEMEVAKAVVAVAPAPAPASESVASAASVAAAAAAEPASPVAAVEPAAQNSNGDIYAGPAVRKLAREFGIDLAKVKATGPRGRLIKDDLQSYVKNLAVTKASAAASGAGLPALPKVDHSLFGEVRVEPRSKMEKLTANNLHASWVNLPHVTQFDEVDISDLDDFRAGLKAEAESRGVKMTPLPFILKAVAAALRANPKFNASISSDGQSTVFKNYVHIGIAVDTPVGLLVPVLRDVDKKSLWELAEESAELAAKAKARKLKPGEMQGGCFTISSLGNIGGTGFTPIINAPELAILGVSKMAIKPQWNGSEFLPAKMLPLSLSYDHRAINGADAGKFFSFLNTALSDVRRLVL
ncbi:MAG: 2-oxo acid dehydrogenase subunit E2, partial [Spongiibacteraceae bacterium]